MDIVTYALLNGKIKKILDAEGIEGKSAYQIAVDAGFEGTEEEWLASLQGEDGVSPHIGDNGNWFIGEEDTGISASGTGSTDLEGYYNEDNLIALSDEDIANICQ